jgi:mono/diheme cytochrome c family protein/uncharacterized membrane protein
MLIHNCAVSLCVCASFAFLFGPAEWQVAEVPAVLAQADPSEGSAAQPSGPATAAGRELFRKQCVKCHGADGTGGPARSLHPEIPDFTAAAWQGQRNDTQLRESILGGKGKIMPSFRGKISAEQARTLVTHVRTFVGAKGKQKSEKQASSTSFDEEMRRLQKELGDLKKEMEVLRRQLDDAHRERERATPPQSSPGSSRSEASAAPSGANHASGQLFRKHCVKCHGADGSGRPVRKLQPQIPDFRSTAWQARHTDTQLLTSIRDGKNKEMPAWRGKISDEQARGLVTHVRAFAPTSEGSEPEEQEEAEEDVPPKGFLARLISWLGMFHPPAVHFPIALLGAAAVAEMLRMITGKPPFEAASRFCVWCGFVTAVAAGSLGWCTGGFHLTDTSWIVTAHRWLGSSTVACAGLALALGEISRRSISYVRWFRAVLFGGAGLVMATGFFGGALVFGLEHYHWPP